MQEIEVGEYVRTSYGTIRKYKYERHKELINENGIYKILTWRGSAVIDVETISKHSKNIINLIEVGDYVNGYKVEEDIEGDLRIYINETSPAKWGYIESIKIKTIVTKEQFASMEYKV